METEGRGTGSEDMHALTIDTKRYGRLLARATSKVIETEEEHDRVLAEAEKLMGQGRRRRPRGSRLHPPVSLPPTGSEWKRWE